MIESLACPSQRLLPSLWKLLRQVAPCVNAPKGRLICAQGQPADRLFVLAEGHVVLCREDPRHEEHALYYLGPGQIFGEGALHPEKRWLISAYAVTTASTFVLPVAELPRLYCHYPELATVIQSLLSIRLEQAHRRLDAQQASGCRERLLALLYALADYEGERAGTDIWLPLHLTQVQLGDMLGMTRETIARTLSLLEKDGTLRRDGRKGVWLSPRPPIGVFTERERDHQTLLSSPGPSGVSGASLE